MTPTGQLTGPTTLLTTTAEAAEREAAAALTRAREAQALADAWTVASEGRKWRKRLGWALLALLLYVACDSALNLVDNLTTGGPAWVTWYQSIVTAAFLVGGVGLYVAQAGCGWYEE